MIDLVVIAGITGYLFVIGIVWSLVPADWKSEDAPSGIFASLFWPFALAVIAGIKVVALFKDRKIPKATAHKK